MKLEAGGRLFSMVHLPRLPELIPAHGGQAEVRETALGLEFSPMTTLTFTISILATQYFIMCTLLASARLFDQLQATAGRERSLVRRILESAELTVNIAPMLCVLFMAVQMQSMLVSQGRADPPPWVLLCMEVAAAAFGTQTILVVIVPVLTRAEPQLDEDSVVVSVGPPVVRAASYLVMLILCTACAGLLAGLIVMGAPPGVPIVANISPAVSCTANLATQFFLVHMCLATLAGSCGRRRGELLSRAIRVLRLAAHTVFFAPMLCVLFVGARMRALHVDPIHGVPQHWAEVAFYACSYTLLVQTLLAVVVPFLPGGDARSNASPIKGDLEIRFQWCEQRFAGLAFILVRLIPCVLVSAGVAAIIASMLTISSPIGQTPPLPPALWCTTSLAALFFAVSLASWGVALSRGRSARRLSQALQSAYAVVRYCPMLAVLFLSLRLRAQQVTRQRGKPQGWATDAMYVCTAVVFLEVVLCLVVAWVQPKQATRDELHPAFRFAAVAQVLLSLALHAAALLLCGALVLLTPAAAGQPGLLAA